ncbi:Lrp/AsnC family transcriptional regulator [Candidatus Woesearchaeota archaeon]|nr:Lrp/AsnC family transcriptional regulator [Candidatus Woesearchaeota archaeon]
MDKKDSAIIGKLKEDSRLSVREIARGTGLRPSTVHQRIQKLRHERVIERFTVKLDNNKADEGFIVFMFVKTKPSVNLGTGILENPHVKEVFGITGEHDLLMKLKFKDVVEFNDYLLKFRKGEKVETTHTMVVTATIKEEM